MAFVVIWNSIKREEEQESSQTIGGTPVPRSGGTTPYISTKRGGR